MKKALLLALLALAPTPAVAAIKVVTTLQDFASLADSVGGKRVEAFSLSRGYQDPHFVDPKPSLILKLSRADLLIAAGLDLEVGYLPPLLDQSRNSKIRPGAPGYLDASVGCEILERPTGVVTRAMGDVHPFGNPHFWLDPANGRRIARAIAAKLTALDPSGAADYKANLAAFEAKLTEGEKRWDAMLAPFAGSQVVTYHNSWPNFLKRFRLKAAGYVEPKPGIPPSPSHTVALINLMRELKVPVILMEPYFDERTPKSIAERTGATLLRFVPSVGGVPQAKDYVSLFDYDVKLLADTLAAKKVGRP
ncbi:MAG: metal ABC transporter substrate-binding protein [Acidobacteriota bacterium]|nr:metal ABC transporter substrate-binding protein [Acidobacteriota bacterium]MDQ5870801.1 metal ABC transporter substrate-binding protein [Acidobacteriota bacterium]